MKYAVSSLYQKPPDQPFLRLCQSGAKPTTDKREPLNLLEPTGKTNNRKSEYFGDYPPIRGRKSKHFAMVNVTKTLSWSCP